ncbi:MAG: hypothetical protein WC091_14785 [Sulfuricellaceae bacterium]
MDEKKAFSQRLVVALKKAGVSATSPTRLAMEFNLHYRGHPVSTPGVHRWLAGTAIPSQDKIRTLAEWLNVSPVWLRFGNAEEDFMDQEKEGGHAISPQLIDDMKRLSVDHLTIVQELVATLLRLGGDNPRKLS